MPSHVRRAAGRRRARSAAPRWALAALELTSLGTAAFARAEPEVREGSYEASAAQLAVKVGAWGEDCGPRPSSRTEPGGEARVASVGGALQITLPDRTLRSDGCWTPNPAVRVTNASRDAAGVRIECKTPGNDAKQETGRYTLSVRADGTLTLVEDSSYDWQLKTSHCVATVKRTQTLVPRSRPGAAPSPDTDDDDTPHACTPGAPAKLRLRPAEARVSPGQRVCFQLRAVDAAGCVLPAAPNSGTLAIVSASDGARGSVKGLCFDADAASALRGGNVRLRVESGALHAEASVRVAAPDLSAITLGDSDEAAATEDAERANDGVFDAGVRAVVAGTGGHPWLAGLLLAAAVGLITLGVRRRRNTEPKGEGQGEAPVRAPKPSSAVAPSAGEPWLCPRCRRGYPAGTARCTVDGEAPIPYTEFRAREARAAAAAKCSACGSALAPGSVFCGVCGKQQG
jgi:hypothetical protein